MIKTEKEMEKGVEENKRERKRKSRKNVYGKYWEKTSIKGFERSKENRGKKEIS